MAKFDSQTLGTKKSTFNEGFSLKNTKICTENVVRGQYLILHRNPLNFPVK